MTQAGSFAMAMRSWATTPWKPQRAGIPYMGYSSQGFVVIGTMMPPSTTCGSSAMGVSAIAASLLVTMVLSNRPMATEFIAVTIMVTRSMTNAWGPPLKSSAKNTIPKSTVHWITQKNDSRKNFEKT